MVYETRTMCTVHCLLLLWVYGVVRDEGPDWGGEDGQHPANQKVDLLVPRQYSLCHHVHRTGNIISRITRIILNIRNKIKVEMFFFIYITLSKSLNIQKTGNLITIRAGSDTQHKETIRNKNILEIRRETTFVNPWIKKHWPMRREDIFVHLFLFYESDPWQN